MCTHLRYGAATKSVGLASQPGGFSDPREACRCNVFGFFSVRFDFSSCAWLSRELSEGDEAETARGVEQTVLFRGFLRRCVTASSLLRERPCAPPLPSREREREKVRAASISISILGIFSAVMGKISEYHFHVAVE